jgi:hypothetical protein
MHSAALQGYVSKSELLDSARQKGALNVYAGDTVVIPPAIETKLSLKELLALRDLNWSRNPISFMNYGNPEALSKSVSSICL